MKPKISVLINKTFLLTFFVSILKCQSVLLYSWHLA